MLPASAGAHPEACANTGAFSGAPTAEWLLDWTAENEGCLSAAVVRFELLATTGAQHSASKLDDAADITSAERYKIPGNKSGVTPSNTKHFPAVIETSSNDSSDSSVHAGRIATAG